MGSSSAAAALLLLALLSAAVPALYALAASAGWGRKTGRELRPVIATRKESLAEMFDRTLKKKFLETEQNDGELPISLSLATAFVRILCRFFSVGRQFWRLARVTPKKNDTKEEKSFQLHNFFNLDNEIWAEDIPILIDQKDNVFIISNPQSKYPVLKLDMRLISDIVVVIVSATCGGLLFACAGQQVITGYLLAGSIIGPGGFNFVSEMVQVATVAQFGVVFLLFALGREFSVSKLPGVRVVAVFGGLLQIILFMCLCGIAALLCGGKLSEGMFVGAFLSMSSTAMVSKFLTEQNCNDTLHGQVTVGTLILQDCAVGFLFALLPVLCGTSGVLQRVISMTKWLILLCTFLAILSKLSHTWVPWFLELIISLSSQTNELYQLASVSFCLLLAWCSDKLGLSLELRSFAAGFMISTTDHSKQTLKQIKPIRNFFDALFLASIGMLVHVHFLWNRVVLLIFFVVAVVIIKTIVVTIVVKGFGYTTNTSIILAQIGELAFVLLSRASNLHLIEDHWYLLLLGTTALSLMTTPLLFKVISAYFQAEMGIKSNKAKMMVQGSHVL